MREDNQGEGMETGLEDRVNREVESPMVRLRRI